MQRPITQYVSSLGMSLLPDIWNCGLRMPRECRERFPRHRLQGKPLVSDPGMYYVTACVTRVPLCMSGSLTRGGGKTFPSFPAHAQPAILLIWEEAHVCNVFWCDLRKLQKFYLWSLAELKSIHHDVRWVQHIEAGTKLPSFPRRHFHIPFLKWKCTKFKNFAEVCS